MDKYHEIMEHIYVTPAMRDRILSGISRHFRGKRAFGARSGRMYSLAAAAAAFVIIGGVGLWQHMRAPQTGITSSYESSGVSDTFAVIDCASAQELSSLMGFDVPELSHLPFEPQEVLYTAIGKDLAQIRYLGSGETDMLTYRKSPGAEDNSGDYNTYSETGSLDINGLSLQIKGHDGLIYLACWSDPEYSYSISIASGCTKEELSAIISDLSK